MRGLAADPGHALYRRVVLGDTSVELSSAVPAAGDAGRQVPGSYARYLIRNGTPKEQALAQAQRIGETPVFIVDDAQRAQERLTPYERYQRSVLGTPDAQIMSSRGREASGASGGIAAKATP